MLSRAPVLKQFSMNCALIITIVTLYQRLRWENDRFSNGIVHCAVPYRAAYFHLLYCAVLCCAALFLLIYNQSFHFPRVHSVNVLRSILSQRTRIRNEIHYVITHFIFH